MKKNEKNDDKNTENCSHASIIKLGLKAEVISFSRFVEMVKCNEKVIQM